MKATAAAAPLLTLLIIAVTGAAAQRMMTRHLQAVSFRQDLVDTINEKRTKNGLESLCINSKLMSAAQVMANDLAENNVVTTTGSDGSTPTQRASAQGYNTTGVYELVGAGYSSASDILAAWMTSDSTKDTIFGNFTHIGPGYTYNKEKEYVNYWTVDFAASESESCDN